ncbi:MAG: TonB-dependent receptor [Bacteroidetes bacterium]|nr:MAG: TonB-dependent receptor [Bacteroidota bacterium]
MKRFKKLPVILLMLILLFPFGVSAGQLLIKGQVINDNKGVPFAAVYVAGTGKGVSTDKDGNFNLVAPAAESLRLGVKGLGYKTIYQDFDAEKYGDFIVIEIEQDYLLLDQVLVSGSRIGLLRYLPGSASVIDAAELRTTLPLSGNEVLRNVPGIHVVEEEGAGLRANIGIRGLDPDKSRNVLILEDGIPVALAPYGEPEMYFTPSIDRMSGVEILKGNGTILFGPQTIGGVINFLTTDPPKQGEGRMDIRAGDKGFFNTQFSYGNTIENFGFTVDFQRKQAENFGPTAFRFHDFNTKLQSRLSPVSIVSFKVGIYDESSNSTYVGLTQPMFSSGEMDDLRIAPDDDLHIRRYAASAIHKYNPVDRLQLNTTVFAYSTVRNWNRQDFTYNANASNITGDPLGFEGERDGAIYLRNSTGQRNRQFEVFGAEPRMSVHYDIGNLTMKTDAGVRYLYEKAFEQRVVGTSVAYQSGNLREDEVRTGHAVSAFVQNNLLVNEKLSFTAGLRNENLWYGREIMRLNYTDTLIHANSEVYALIPGAGVNYNFTNNLGLFAGIHRGFAPPRTKDAISNDGADLQLDAEKSWNTEIGARLNFGKMEWEYALFMMNFSNQVIPVSESSGGMGTGYVNGGETLHRGMELSMLLPFDEYLPQNWGAQVSFAGTWVNSVFSSDRYVLSKVAQQEGLDNVYVNVNGNHTPYAPELTMAAAFILENAAGWGVRLSANYTGSQYTDALNTNDVYQWIQINQADNSYNYVQATANGRIGKLDPYMIANLSAWYKHSGTGLGFNVSVKNLLNERYIVTRRPQGIRVGMPRFVSAGVSYGF